MVCDHLKVCSRKVNSEMLYALYYGQAFLFHGAVSCFPRQLFSRNGSGLINTWFETRASFRDLNASLLSGVQTILVASFFFFFAVSMYCNSSKRIVCIVTERLAYPFLDRMWVFDDSLNLSFKGSNPS